MLEVWSEGLGDGSWGLGVRIMKMENSQKTRAITIGIVVADFNKEITDAMLKTAEDRAKEKAVFIAYTIHVPGVFDMPLAVKRLLQKKEIEGVVTIGAVISGGTAHDSHVAENAARQISNLSLEFDKPVTLSVIGHNVSRQQAYERIESYAKHGIDAVIELIKVLN